MFSLSLFGTPFSWFASLALGLINSWFDIDNKFHEHFFFGSNELKLSHLVKQQHDESIVDYLKRFRDTQTFASMFLLLKRI